MATQKTFMLLIREIVSLKNLPLDTVDGIEILVRKHHGAQ